MSRDAVLVVHVMAGTLGLLLGPASLLTRARARWLAAWAYQVAVAWLAVTAVVLAALDLRTLWWLVPIAVVTQGAALLGVVVWRRRRPGWPGWCAHLLGGSYVSLVTGFLVISTGNLVFWVLPALLAQWPIAVAKGRLRAVDDARRGLAGQDGTMARCPLPT